MGVIPVVRARREQVANPVQIKLHFNRAGANAPFCHPTGAQGSHNTTLPLDVLSFIPDDRILLQRL
jgi:hypothetical protein